jgi:hypothetical protein
VEYKIIGLEANSFKILKQSSLIDFIRLCRAELKERIFAKSIVY